MFTGRPGNWIKFSANQGKDWVGWYEVDSAPSAHDCTHYNGLEEALNTLLAVFTSFTAASPYGSQGSPTPKAYSIADELALRASLKSWVLTLPWFVSNLVFSEIS